MKIRFAQPDEALKIVQLHINTWRQSYRGYIEDDKIQTMCVTNERIENMRQQIENKSVFVAEEKGEIIGFATLSDTIEKNQAEIRQLYIRPDYQRRGIGQRLLKFVFLELKKCDCQTAFLWTLKNFRASNQFYQKIGGKLTSQEKQYKMGFTTIKFIFDLNKEK